MPFLEILDLTECSRLKTEVCCLIAENCRFLHTLVLCWCTDIGSRGIREVV